MTDLRSKISNATQLLISLSDIGNLVGLPILTLISWILPAAGAPHFCRAAARMNAAMLTSDRQRLIRQIDALIGDRPLPLDAHESLDAVAAEDLLSLMNVLRTHRSRTWRGDVEVLGLENLTNALAAGTRAVLWRAHFAHYAIPYYTALVDKGFTYTHFSHVRHGFSSTRFGIRVLNPIRLSGENYFVPERVERTDAAPTGALRTLYRKLENNGIVSITTRGDADQYISVPFLNGMHDVAPGGPHLAYAKSAGLLPVFPLRLPDGRYEIHIMPRIKMNAATSRNAAIEGAAVEFGRMLETYVTRYPSQWLGWMHL
ncbi:MAG: hypothetical protein VYD85_04475 [Pseudomonadota bacterium]|nr:hypothetical protein [Pseudomonadota bacterium]